MPFVKWRGWMEWLIKITEIKRRNLTKVMSRREERWLMRRWVGRRAYYRIREPEDNSKKMGLTAFRVAVGLSDGIDDGVGAGGVM